MTDGIIQEVFNPRINARKIKPVEREILECMKEELIEKIKQEWKVINNTHAMWCSCNVDIEILKMLIGDNQE